MTGQYKLAYWLIVFAFVMFALLYRYGRSMEEKCDEE